MRVKSYNSYRVVHTNSVVEEINASSVLEAIEHMTMPETESKIAQITMLKEGVATVVDDGKKQFNVLLRCSPAEAVDIEVYPKSFTMHTDDTVTVSVSKHRGEYGFVGWKIGQELISREETFQFMLPEDADRIYGTSIELVAVFEPAKLNVQVTLQYNGLGEMPESYGAFPEKQEIDWDKEAQFYLTISDSNVVGLENRDVMYGSADTGGVYMIRKVNGGQGLWGFKMNEFIKPFVVDNTIEIVLLVN